MEMEAGFEALAGRATGDQLKPLLRNDQRPITGKYT